MAKVEGAERWVPRNGDIAQLRKAAKSCRGCGLYEDATQTVFGEGDPNARAVFIGEMPGDREDREGLPFVGPAGTLLDRAISEAGIDPADTYRTNVVKHFKFTQTPERGKRRIHQTPNRTEIVACRPWLLSELRALDPVVMVVLGATAGKAIFGSAFRITKSRGQLLVVPQMDGQPISRGRPTAALATIHPSAVLRSNDRAALYDGVVEDLRVAAGVLDGSVTLPTA